MPLPFPRRLFHGGRTIDAFSFNSLPPDDRQPSATAVAPIVRDATVQSVRPIADDRSVGCRTVGEDLVGVSGLDEGDLRSYVS